MAIDPQDAALIGTYATAQMGRIIASALESEKISVAVVVNGAEGAFPRLNLVGRGVGLFVSSADEKRAREIARAIEYPTFHGSLTVGHQIIEGGAHEIMARALEAEAALQEQGVVKRIGEAYDPTYGQILEIDSDYDNSIAFAFTFWDKWVDASNHDWRYHEPFTQGDWPRFAREIARAVRQKSIPEDRFLVEHILLKPRRTLWQWLKNLFRQAS